MSSEPPDPPPSRVVIDASALVALMAKEPESEIVSTRIADWISHGVELHAPELARYEIANALTRKASIGEVQTADLPAVWAELDAMPIVYHPLSNGERAITLALELERRSAFDAAYVALAQALDAELWTLDGPLARNASSRGIPVSLIDSPPEKGDGGDDEDQDSTS